MTTQLHDTGEEAIIKDFFTENIAKPASVSVGLYNDGTDNLGDSGDIGTVTSEPTGSNYNRQTASFGTADWTSSDNGSGNWQAVMDDQTFDTSNSGQNVDSYFVVINYQSSDKGDAAANDHLLFTGPLDQSYDLSNVDQFTLSGAGLALD